MWPDTTFTRSLWKGCCCVAKQICGSSTCTHNGVFDACGTHTIRKSCLGTIMERHIATACLNHSPAIMAGGSQSDMSSTTFTVETSDSMQQECCQKGGGDAIKRRWNHGRHIARSAVPGEVVIIKPGARGHGEFRGSPHALQIPCSPEKDLDIGTRGVRA